MRPLDGVERGTEQGCHRPVRRDVVLARRPRGQVRSSDFTVVEATIPPLRSGEVLVRTDRLMVASMLQDMMDPDCAFPVPTFVPGRPMIGAPSVGTVIDTRSAHLRAGDLVYSMAGWSDLTFGPDLGYQWVARDRFPDPSYYLSQGPTALLGMEQVAEVTQGDIVLVTGAAGAVGSLAGQIARVLGARTVIGTAGGPVKAERLVADLGFDAGLDYTATDLAERLGDVAPDGIDVLFDTTGGPQLELALTVARRGARFVLCGALAAQADPSVDGRARFDSLTAITREIRVRPFLSYDTEQQVGQWLSRFETWLRDGRLVFPLTLIHDTLDAAPQLLVDLLKGRFVGNVSLALTP